MSEDLKGLSMREELKIGDRVDIIVKYQNRDEEIRENLGSITHIERTYRIESDNGYVAYHDQYHVRKHIPQPKPGDLVRFKGRDADEPFIFVTRACTSDGHAYWVCEYGTHESRRRMLSLEEDQMCIVPKSEQSQGKRDK